MFRPFKVRRSVAATASVAAVVASGVAFAGEKIRVGGESDSSATPPAKSQSLNRPFENKSSLPGTSDVVPIVPITPPNTRTSVSPGIEEMIERKKNWIFTRPSSKQDERAEIEDILGVRKYEFEGMERKSKSSVERYFETEAEGQKEASSKFRKNSKDSDADSAERRDSVRDAESGTSALPVEMDLRTSMSPAGAFDPLRRKGAMPSGLLDSQPENVLPRSLNAGSRFNASEFLEGSPRSDLGGNSQLTGSEQRMQEFQKLFAPGGKSAGVFADPINLYKDGTRQVLNPVVGGAAKEQGVGINSSLASPGASAMPSFSAPTPLAGAVAPRISAGPSLGSSIMTPPPAPRMQARPPVLELPRRSF